MITVFVLMLVMSMGASGVAQVNWMTLEQAQERAKTNPKKILVEFYDPGCEDCQSMLNTTMTHPWIAKYVNANYYAVKFNVFDRNVVKFQGAEFGNTDKTLGYHDLAYALGDMNKDGLTLPTTVFLEANASYITFVEGPFPPKKFEPFLTYIGSDAYQSVAWPQYQADFRSQIQ